MARSSSAGARPCYLQALVEHHMRHSARMALRTLVAQRIKADRAPVQLRRFGKLLQHHGRADITTLHKIGGKDRFDKADHGFAIQLLLGVIDQGTDQSRIGKSLNRLVIELQARSFGRCANLGTTHFHGTGPPRRAS